MVRVRSRSVSRSQSIHMDSISERIQSFRSQTQRIFSEVDQVKK